ncbi:pyridoxal phosphate-dependent transferase [Aspergillus insuetus]
MDLNNVSEQMSSKLKAIIPAINASHGGSPADDIVPAVDLSLAENDLLREEILALAKNSLTNHLKPKDLAYPAGFGGDPALLASLARFFNANFNPSTPVQPDHIVATSGAGNALDALLCGICNQGDKVLVVCPCWEGFAPYFRIHADVTPIPVAGSSPADATTMSIVGALKATYEGDPNPAHIKAVVITNPNNPLGRCYAPEVLQAYLRFCAVHNLHFISDEVYALSSFREDHTLPPFTSALSLLDGNENLSLSPIMAFRVHVVWSLSKDFGCSGIRLGCIVTQANAALRLGAGLASYWQVSSLASVLAKALLDSPDLAALMQRNSQALGEAYRVMTEGLDRLGIEYASATHGLFVFARVVSSSSGGGGCSAQQEAEEEEEATAVQTLRRMGLVIAPGRRFMLGATSARECGWIRITFATGEGKIQRALDAIARFRGLE